jgi:hypothetical protein
MKNGRLYDANNLTEVWPRNKSFTSNQNHALVSMQPLKFGLTFS